MDIVRRAVPEIATALAASGIAPVLARVFAARGVRSPAELDLELRMLPSWRALKGIDAAAARLASAIEQHEPLLIVADYDADGATACAVGVRGLRAMGARVDYLVPNRFEFGYGLTPEIVALAAQREPAMIITVDNGIASVDGVAEARARGIEVLITDHHLPGAELPATALIVNPNQPGCTFPSKHLAGVGVMFYVLAAVRALLRERRRFAAGDGPNLAALLDLVALGTVADVAQLRGLNRAFVTQGLKVMAARRNIGLVALAEAAHLHRAPECRDLGFALGPRINAGGRVGKSDLGVRLLTSTDPEEARSIAAELPNDGRSRVFIDINFKGPFRLSSLVGEQMMAGDGGVIINLSSTASVLPMPHTIPYGGAKSGINFDPASPDAPAVLRAFVDAIRPFIAERYATGADLGTREEDIIAACQLVGLTHPLQAGCLHQHQRVARRYCRSATGSSH